MFCRENNRVLRFVNFICSWLLKVDIHAPFSIKGKLLCLQFNWQVYIDVAACLKLRKKVLWIAAVLCRLNTTLIYWLRPAIKLFFNFKKKLVSLCWKDYNDCCFYSVLKVIYTTIIYVDLHKWFIGIAKKELIKTICKNSHFITITELLLF